MTTVKIGTQLRYLDLKRDYEVTDISVTNYSDETAITITARRMYFPGDMVVSFEQLVEDVENGTAAIIGEAF